MPCIMETLLFRELATPTGRARAATLISHSTSNIIVEAQSRGRSEPIVVALPWATHNHVKLTTLFLHLAD